MEKKFDRRNYPYDVFSRFGLTEGMLLDLPDYVHDIIECGGKSPLLPLTVKRSDGSSVRCYAKFSLVDFDGSTEVLFYPKYKNADLSRFDEQQRDSLLEGKVIVADVEDRFVTEEGVEDEQVIRAFVQLDKDTNSVVYSPTQTIGRNISALGEVYGLDGDELKRFWDGGLVMAQVRNSEDIEEPVTIGVDLFTETGVIAVPGISEQWIMAVRRGMPEYSFGVEGCWVNRGGKLAYVPEESFTPDILAAQQETARQRALQMHNETEQVPGHRFEDYGEQGESVHQNIYDQYDQNEESRGMGY